MCFGLFRGVNLSAGQNLVLCKPKRTDFAPKLLG